MKLIPARTGKPVELPGVTPVRITLPAKVVERIQRAQARKRAAKVAK